MMVFLFGAGTMGNSTNNGVMEGEKILRVKFLCQYIKFSVVAMSEMLAAVNSVLEVDSKSNVRRWEISPVE